jgi:hypothetical protein
MAAAVVVAHIEFLEQQIEVVLVVLVAVVEAMVAQDLRQRVAHQIQVAVVADKDKILQLLQVVVVMV